MELFVLGAWLKLGPGSKEQRLAIEKSWQFSAGL